MQKDLGLVTAYGAALEGGYTGTFEDYKTKMLELLDYQIQESYDDTELRELINLKADKTEIPAAYDDSQIRNLINGKMDRVNLATVATSGSYNDLSNKPSINLSWTLYSTTDKPDETSKPYGGGGYFGSIPASLLEDYNEIYMFLITANFNTNELISDRSNLTNKGTKYDYNIARYNLSYGHYVPTDIIKKGLNSASRTSTYGDAYFVSEVPYSFSRIGEETIGSTRYNVNIMGVSRGSGVGITAGPAKKYFEEEIFDLRISFPDYIDLVYIYTPFVSGTNKLNYEENCIVKYSNMRHAGMPGYAYLYVR